MIKKAVKKSVKKAVDAILSPKENVENIVRAASYEVAVTPPTKNQMTKISEDMGREDLNLLAQKVNEIIDRLND